MVSEQAEYETINNADNADALLASTKVLDFVSTLRAVGLPTYSVEAVTNFIDKKLSMLSHGMAREHWRSALLSPCIMHCSTAYSKPIDFLALNNAKIFNAFITKLGPETKTALTNHIDAESSTMTKSENSRSIEKVVAALDELRALQTVPPFCKRYIAALEAAAAKPTTQKEESSKTGTAEKHEKDKSKSTKKVNKFTDKIKEFPHLAGNAEYKSLHDLDTSNKCFKCGGPHRSNSCTVTTPSAEQSAAGETIRSSHRRMRLMERNTPTRPLPSEAKGVSTMTPGAPSGSA
jgi:hypothetical protein